MRLCPPPTHLLPQTLEASCGRARRRVAVLLNQRARQVDHALLQRLAALVGPEHVYASESLAEAERLARQVVHGRYDVVACGGGDGTLTGTFNRLRRYVAEANAWREHARFYGRPAVAAWHVPTLAFLALGTGNAVRFVVNNRSVVADVTRLLYDDQLIVQDVPLIEMPTGEHFLFGGLGYDSLLLSDYQRFIADYPLPALKSLLGYVAAVACRTLPRVAQGGPLLTARVTSVGAAWYFDPTLGDRPVSLGRDVTLFDGDASLLAVGTIAYFGYGLRVFPFANAVPRTMHVRIANLSAPRLLGVLPQLWRGTLRDPRRLRDFAAEGVRIELAEPFAFEHSGDDQGPWRRLTLQVAREPLRLVSFAPAERPALRAS